MDTNQKTVAPRPAEEKDVYAFNREGDRWYISTTALPEQSWSKRELELVHGVHKILGAFSNGASLVRLRMATEDFEGANVLELVEHCSAPKGGGIYLLNPEKDDNSSLFWICDLALFAFGDIPERMYVKTASVE